MVDQKAKDLGRFIGQSPEYQAVKRANDALQNDRDAVTSLNRMEQLRQEAQRLLGQGKEPTDEMERELDDLLTKIQGNPNYQRAISAQENFDKLMIQVNSWISEGMKAGAASPIITLT